MALCCTPHKVTKVANRQHTMWATDRVLQVRTMFKNYINNKAVKTSKGRLVPAHQQKSETSRRGPHTDPPRIVGHSVDYKLQPISPRSYFVPCLHAEFRRKKPGGPTVRPRTDTRVTFPYFTAGKRSRPGN